MSNKTPEAGDVFINKNGKPTPFPTLVLPDHTGKLVLYLLCNATSSNIRSFVQWANPIEILKEDRFLFLFNISGKDLEDYIVGRYNRGEFKDAN